MKLCQNDENNNTNLFKQQPTVTKPLQPIKNWNNCAIESLILRLMLPITLGCCRAKVMKSLSINCAQNKIWAIC